MPVWSGDPPRGFCVALEDSPKIYSQTLKSRGAVWPRDRLPALLRRGREAGGGEGAHSRLTQVVSWRRGGWRRKGWWKRRRLSSSLESVLLLLARESSVEKRECSSFVDGPYESSDLCAHALRLSRSASRRFSLIRALSASVGATRPIAGPSAGGSLLNVSGGGNQRGQTASPTAPVAGSGCGGGGARRGPARRHPTCAALAVRHPRL